MTSKQRGFTEPGYWAELERLGDLVDKLVEENARLRAENESLGRALAAGDAPSPDTEALRARLDEERAAWQRQRRALADRLEIILGKFQWLEGQKSSAASLVDG